MQLRVEFVFGVESKEDHFDEKEFESEKEEDVILFLCGDDEVDLIFFYEDFHNLDEGQKFDDDGRDFMEDKAVFGDDGFVIEVVSQINPQVPQKHVPLKYVDYIPIVFKQEIFVFKDFVKVCKIYEKTNKIQRSNFCQQGENDGDQYDDMYK
ncbi:hypothetical protein Scep_030482 [Stephania cephalantha]|uniref:Uncharacterized protein n=1 Tax=Stephania cephalantha TaxID=152367 RepID=A0AAP0DZU7_9MAGN